MKKVYRVLCEVDNGYTIERYNTYVFANGEEEAERVALQYWNDKKYEIDEKDSTDLKILINRWTKSKSSRPSWKVIKLFMNEDLLPDDNLIYQPFPDMSL